VKISWCAGFGTDGFWGNMTHGKVETFHETSKLHKISFCPVVTLGQVKRSTYAFFDSKDFKMHEYNP